jgi:hypothetical protein
MPIPMMVYNPVGEEPVLQNATIKSWPAFVAIK